MREFYCEHNMLKVVFKERNRDIFFNLVRFVKTLDGAYFDNIKKCWFVYDTEDNRERLKRADFVFYGGLQEKQESKKIICSEKVKSLKGFREYQKEGVQFLLNRNGRGLIGDEQGLGKTITAIGYLKVNSELRPVLIICPGSVKYNWAREIKKWMDINSVVVSGRTLYNIGRPDIVIINYDIVKDWLVYLLKLKFSVLIIDESHYISNRKAQRTEAVIQLAKKIPKFIALSGTPIKNRPKEFFTVLNILDPVVFKSEYQYKMKFCDPKHNGFGWTYNGASNVDLLNKLISPLMIRREKSEVLKELPEKQQIILDVSGDLTEYNKVAEEIRWKLKGELSKLQVRNLLDYLKSLTWNVKRNYVFQWIDDFLESGQKLVVFGVHRAVIMDIYNKYRKIAVRVDGGVSMLDRQEAIDKFQNNKNVKLFVGNIQSAGVGITLTASSTVLFTELSWVPSDHSQAEDRVHRIGQKNSVFIYYIIAKDTIESKMVRVLLRKSKTVSKILDGKEKKLFVDDIYRIL